MPRPLVCLLLFASLVCGPCSNHAHAGPLRNLLNRGHGGGGGGGGNCEDGSCRVGPNQSIVGTVPQHLWPTAPQATPQEQAILSTAPAAPTITVAAPVADATATVKTITVEQAVDAADDVAIREITRQLAETSERLQRLQAGNATVKPALAPGDERMAAIERKLNAIAKSLDVEVEEEPTSSAAELIDNLPTLRLAVVDEEGATVDTAELDFSAIAREKLGVTPPPTPTPAEEE